MPDAKTVPADIDVHVHLTLIDGKLNVEYEATPNHVAMVTGALSMASSRVYAAWEKDGENAERGAASIAAWEKEQIAKRAGGVS